MRAGTGLLLATALAAMTCTCAAQPRLAGRADGAASAGPPGKLTTLYDQTRGDTGVGIVSQNFESSFDAYDCFAADDFIVPSATHWRIKEVTILGTYFNGSGAASSQNVALYRDRHGRPGHLIASYDVVGDDSQGDFVIAPAKVPRMKPGRYWISVQTNQTFNGAGEWGWRISDAVVNKPAVWRNPGDGFGTGCVDWGREKTCLGSALAMGDHLFSLAGRSFVDG